MGRQVGLTTPLQRNIGAIDTDLFVDNPAHRELPRSRYSIKA
jgi:hypothetical protein